MGAFANRKPRRQSLVQSLPLYGAIVGEVVVAAGVALMPNATLETLVWSSGVASLIPVAAPPLGTTARVLLALGGGVLVAALLWSSLFLLFGPGGVFAKRAPREDGMPVIRRADAHPDARPRRPMSAADLGTPMMEVGIGSARDERAIPIDLDLPLAAYDPKAMRPVPMEAMRPIAPLVQTSVVAPVIEAVSTAEPETFLTVRAARVFEVPVEPGPERIAPTPVVRPSRPAVESTAPLSIEALLLRLEQGASLRRRAGSH
jgi:hypothetical protein